MESIEVSGKTVEEAIQRALEQLKISREQVEITVLKKGRTGILGLGAEEARVKVTPLPSPQAVPEVRRQDMGMAEVVSPSPSQGIGEAEAVSEAPARGVGVAQVAKEILEALLGGMKITAQVQIQRARGGSSRGILLEITGINNEDIGALIGRRGQTLASLQHLVRLIVAHRFKTPVPLTIDVEGYKYRHYRSLRHLALRLAEKVKSSGQPITLEPMPADERRIIHLALANNPEVTTESLGEDEERKVVITLRKREEVKPEAREAPSQ